MQSRRVFEVHKSPDLTMCDAVSRALYEDMEDGTLSELVKINKNLTDKEISECKHDNEQDTPFRRQVCEFCFFVKVIF